MRHHDATAAGRWRKFVLGGSLVLLGLAAGGLPDSHAQMYYSGGFTPRRQYLSDKTPPQESSPKTPAPTAPKTPSAYSPDNDLAYPSYYLGGAKPPPSPPPYNILSSSLPWNQAGFEDYTELPQMPRDASIGEAKKYSLVTTLLPPPPGAERPATAVLIVHLPEHAVFWVEGTQTRSTGRTRYFQSPPLVPGQKYNYRVRAAWIEDGRWVSQTRRVAVEAGHIQAVYLRPPLAR
jgi:uncharacterized protein (TIGR03000 family)